MSHLPHHCWSCDLVSLAPAGRNTPPPPQGWKRVQKSTIRALPSCGLRHRLAICNRALRGRLVGCFVPVAATIDSSLERNQERLQAGVVGGVLKDLAYGKGTSLPG